MSRKTATFTQLLEYINKPKERGETPLLFNLQNNNDDLDLISKEFQNNSKFRKQKGSTRNNLYHEIISFPEEDSKHLTLDMILDICSKYLELRSPNSLAYAKAHGDTKNPHVHIMISSNDFRSSNQNWISKKRFKQIKQELEFYQREKYPQLSQALSKDQPKKSLSDKETQIQKTGRDTIKEKLGKLILISLENSENIEEFKEKLEKQKITFYQRSEKTCGIIDSQTNKKYRLKTLGVQESFENFQRNIERVKELEAIKQKKLTLQINELNFKEDLLFFTEKIVENKDRSKSKKELRRERGSKSIRRKLNRIKRRENKKNLNLPRL